MAEKYNSDKKSVSEDDVINDIKSFFERTDAIQDEMLKQRQVAELAELFNELKLEKKPRKEALYLVNNPDILYLIEDDSHKSTVKVGNQRQQGLKLKERKFLNIYIPEKAKVQVTLNKTDTSKAVEMEMSEDIDSKLRQKAFERFMKDFKEKLNLSEDVEHETIKVYTEDDLEKEIKAFVKKNKGDFGKLFINLMTHGSEAGKIATHGKMSKNDGKMMSNDTYVKFLDKLALDEKIAIQTIMGQCYSYKYDQNNITLGGNLSVYATTTEEFKLTKIYIEKFSYNTVQTIVGDEFNITEIHSAVHRGYQEYLDDLGQPNEDAKTNQQGQEDKNAKPTTALTTGGNAVEILTDNVEKLTLQQQ